MGQLRMLERLDEMEDLGEGRLWIAGFGMVQHRLVQLELGIYG